MQCAGNDNYEVLYTWSLRYNIFSAWLLDLRISTCLTLFSFFKTVSIPFSSSTLTIYARQSQLWFKILCSSKISHEKLIIHCFFIYTIQLLLNNNCITYFLKKAKQWHSQAPSRYKNSLNTVLNGIFTLYRYSNPYRLKDCTHHTSSFICICILLACIKKVIKQLCC